MEFNYPKHQVFPFTTQAAKLISSSQTLIQVLEQNIIQSRSARGQ